MRWKSLLTLTTACAALLVASHALAQALPQMNILPFFFSVEIDLRDDGSGTMSLSYPATPITNFATERRRFASETTEATDVQVRDGLVFTIVSFRDIARLKELPELANVTAERRTEADGTRRVSARLRAPFVGEVATEEKVTITVTLPGEVLQSNSGGAAGGRTAVWKAPARQYFQPDGIDIQVSYKPDAPQRGG